MTDLDRLRDLLPTEQPLHRVRKMWRVIETSATSTPAKQRRTRTVRTVAVAMGSALVVAFGMMLWPNAASGPLQTADLKPITPHFHASTDTVHHFSDGSSLKTSRNSEIALAENTDKNVLFMLHEGSARFDIVPGGRRRWQVACGSVMVTVLGTVFTVSREEEQVSVTVERGEVLVTSDALDAGDARLVAGESLSVGQEAKTEAAGRNPDDPANALSMKKQDQEVSPEMNGEGETTSPHAVLPKEELPETLLSADTSLCVDAQKREKRSRGQIWRIHAEAGDYAEAFVQLGPSGVIELAKQSESIDELFRLADVARLSGHPKEAVEPLQKILSHFENNPRAGLAAYTLGRLYLEQLHSPKKAAAAFDTALALGIPEALKESAAVKTLKALLLMGDPRGNALAADFLSAYPESRYRDQVEKWIKDGKKSVK